METLEQQALGLILPKGVFKWFDIIGSQSDEKSIKIILEEKNIPPLTKVHKVRIAIPKGFTKITITDFPYGEKEPYLLLNAGTGKWKGRKNI